jgi:hypothetical protein
MLLILTFAKVTTNIRGKPDQLNSPLPPCETVERESKASKVKKCSDGTVPCPMSPHRRKRTGEDPSSHFPISTPGLAETRKAGSVLRISKDKLGRKANCSLLKKAEIRYILYKKCCRSNRTRSSVCIEFRT